MMGRPSVTECMLQTSLERKLTVLETAHMRFIIMDCPTNDTLPIYIKELQKHHTRAVVQVCEPSYSSDLLLQAGMQVYNLKFPDGESPPTSIIDKWLSIVRATFDAEQKLAANATHANSPPVSRSRWEHLLRRTGLRSADTSATPVTPPVQPSTSSVPTMAVHCIAGLGRAPMLVAIALIESGMKPLTAVEFIRERRRGAFNSRQLQFLLSDYKKRGHWKSLVVPAKTTTAVSSTDLPSPPHRSRFLHRFRPQSAKHAT